MHTRMTEVLENPLASIAMNAMVSGAPKPPPKNDYRYYHCQLDWDGLHCKKVDGSTVIPTGDCTKLLFVKSTFPERLDKHILKYKWIPDTVSITK